VSDVLNSVFSALPLRSLRLCGEIGVLTLHRGVAENAENAQRILIGATLLLGITSLEGVT
jgi:hypothetical protein